MGVVKSFGRVAGHAGQRHVCGGALESGGRRERPDAKGAEANRLIAESIRRNPELIRYRYVDALSKLAENDRVQIVPPGTFPDPKQFAAD